jgi:hypothetical protein
LYFVGWVEPAPSFLLQALLGFVALNPTYILPVLLRNAKPNNGRFPNRAPKVTFLIRPAIFLAGGGAYNHITVTIRPLIPDADILWSKL